MKRITHTALPVLFATILFALVGPPIASAQTITSFSVSGASNTFSAAISASGTIAGEYLDGAGLHGFLWAPNGTITTIDPPFCPVGTTGIVSSNTINSAGAVVGFCNLSTGFLQRVFPGDPLGNGFTEISPPNQQPPSTVWASFSQHQRHWRNRGVLYGHVVPHSRICGLQHHTRRRSLTRPLTCPPLPGRMRRTTAESTLLASTTAVKSPASISSLPTSRMDSCGTLTTRLRLSLRRSPAPASKLPT